MQLSQLLGQTCLRFSHQAADDSVVVIAFPRFVVAAEMDSDYHLLSPRAMICLTEAHKWDTHAASGYGYSG